LVACGHSWLSIKKYTLSEIGNFYKTIVLMEREKKAANLTDMWMGNNLEFKGLNEVLSDLGVKKPKKEKPKIAEVNKDWKRLATFMAGRK